MSTSTANKVTVSASGALQTPVNMSRVASEKTWEGNQ